VGSAGGRELETLNSILSAVKIAVGLGLVIFIHELGHFLMAKWNGVKVEKFSIGFGPTLFGFRRGETEYVIAALPLGGFVKMLGEGPDDEANKSTDPRAYPNKSVSARMAIISAGVIMNVFLAFGCFAFYYANPRLEQPPNLGSISAGTPAYLAGFRPGDEIVAIDGRGDLGYADLLEKVVLSSSGQVIHFRVRRPGQAELIDIDLEASREGTSDRPTIGVIAGHSLEVLGFRAPAGMEGPPKYDAVPDKEFQSKVDVVASGGPGGEAPKPLANALEYDRLLTTYRDRPLTFHIERRAVVENESTERVLESHDLMVPPNYFVDFGVRLTMEPITAVRKDSPAETAGFRKGDRIKTVDGISDFDPMQLPEICYRKAGKPMIFEIERPTPAGIHNTVTLTVTPEDRTPYRTPERLVQERENEPVDVPGLGFCFLVHPSIVAVREGSPAARAGLKPGDVISSLTLKTVEPAEKPGAKPKTDSFTFTFKDRTSSWFSAFIRMQSRQYQEIELVVNNASTPVKIMPERDTSWLYSYRGLEFQGMRRTLPGQGFTQALKSGYDRTIQTVLLVYSTFRSLVQRRVSPKNLGGPIMIFQMGYGAAGAKFSVLVYFLGILSINLAVLNFLPIPPLDGGQMVFLVAEKVRGRPLPDSAVLAGSYFGLFLVLCLMVFVTYQDIYRLIFGPL
jgi:regulator of sigma E protease